MHLDCHMQVLGASTDPDILNTDPLAVRNAAALRSDLQKLPARLRTFLEQQPHEADGEAGPSDLSNIFLARSAVITSKLPWDTQEVYLETVRGNPDFHGKHWYDCVSIDNGGEAPWYGQLVALFSHAAKAKGFALCVISLLLHRCQL